MDPLSGHENWPDFALAGMVHVVYHQSKEGCEEMNFVRKKMDSLLHTCNIFVTSSL